MTDFGFNTLNRAVFRAPKASNNAKFEKDLDEQRYVAYPGREKTVYRRDAGSRIMENHSG
ncbi:TPA: hypothetical protein ACPYU1_003426 [Raoultella planticola]